MKNFEKVNPRPSFPEIDAEIISFWKKDEIFKKCQGKESPKGNFVFFEGPPTANGRPGIHHVLSRVFKDLIPRYKTMQGYHVDRKGGWDTHGLPVEIEVEKNLGISGKKQIENYGIEKFNKKCRESVWKYVSQWEELTEKIGYWLDVENAYITYDPHYIETLWWILGEAWKKGFLFEGYKVVPYCPRCGTALSSHEIAQGYQEITEETIFVKFPVEGETNTFFLVWTTTPWTLSGNSGLAFGPKIKYVKVEAEKLTGPSAEGKDTNYQKREFFILAKNNYEDVLRSNNYVPLAVEEYSAQELIAKFRSYNPLYPEGKNHKQGKETIEHKLILGDFVTTEDGTGIVHIAPAFGEDDYQTGRIQNNLSVFMTVNEEGEVLAGPGKGKFVKEADGDIIADLQGRGLLLGKERHTHTYPFCWRCGKPLIYYARNTWYIKMSALRKDLVENNEQVHWYPANIKEGRFGEWIREAKDWALSRERYWGTPLPIWTCQKCGQKELISSYAELSAKSGRQLPSDFDPHRPYIDDYKWSCSCGGTFERYPLVLDCWFDSGSMPFAQWGYPYQNQSKKKFDEHFPADYICEAIDQTRGWFYTLLAVSTLLKKGPAYKNVISLGHILDELGRKMSKSKGNVVNPEEVLSVQGADATRWYMYGATTPGNPRNFSVKLVGEAKRFLLTYWNVYSFFVTYASVDHYQPRLKSEEIKKRNILDRWILSRKAKLIKKVTQLLDHYNIYAATVEIEGFLDELSNWYVRRSRRRFWKAENDEDKNEAYDTLHGVLVDFTKILAPFVPFVTEEIFRNLSDETESVHLAAWPKANTKEIAEELESQMTRARQIVEMGLAQRNGAGIKIRQPLANLSYDGEKLPLEMEKIIAEEVNVKRVIYLSGDDRSLIKDENEIGAVTLDKELTQALKDEGIYREIVRQVQEMRKKAGFQVENRIKLYWKTRDQDLVKIMVGFENDIRKEVLALQMKEVTNDSSLKGFVETVRLSDSELHLAVEKV